MRRLYRGFTLLEVLVALAIVGITAVALVSQTRSSLNVQGQLEQKQRALLAAENLLQDMQAQKRWPLLGTQRRPLELGPVSATLEIAVSATSDEFLRRIDIRISDDARQLVELSAFQGRH